MPYAQVNGQRLHYTDSGGDKPVVIFSHGFLMDLTMFDHQVEEFRNDYRCIAWDERGFGQTEFDGKPFTYWDSADDCIGLLTHLGVEHAVLAGMSQGGFLSLRAALRYPDRVRGLVLIDTQAGDESEAREAYRGLLDAWAAYGATDELAYTVAGIIINDPVENLKWIAKWKLRDRATLAEPGNCLLNRDDITGQLAQIHCPSVIIHGLDDAAIPLEKAQQMRVALPGFQHLEIIEHAGHASNLTHPDQTNRAIKNFLSGLPA
jgi:3-oxoadipate enol-lactonase